MLGAVLLIVALFLDWYDIGISGWDVFETWDAVLAGIAVLVLMAALPLPTPVGSVPWAALGPLAVGIVVLQLLNPPPAATGADPDLGAWLALVGAVFLVGGHLLSRASVSIALQTETDATHVASRRGEAR